MQRRVLWLFLVPLTLSVFCAAACTDSAGVTPTAPTASIPSSSALSAIAGVDDAPSVAGSESPGCYSVQFRGKGPDFPVLTLSGDLEGTVKYSFGSSFPAGVTFHSIGRAEWTITGGKVPGLTTFHTAVKHKNFPWKDTPQSPNTVFEQSGTHSTDWDWIAPGPNGVRKANLSYTGTTVLSSPTPPYTKFTDYRFWGVICP
jgi:hypothetical protein